MGANNNNSIDKIEEIWEYDEKMKKRELVINTIVQRSAFSSHQILQGINEAASPSSATGSSKVEAIVLSGGYTNYSYKIFVPGQPHLCLFAKLTFERAIWNPDKDALYDLQRTVNEAENEKARDYVRDSMGVLGLKLMRVCYDTEYVPETTTLKELTFMFNTLVDEELTQAYALSTPKGRVQPRKSSLLRISNRRVSDAGIV